LSFFHIFHIIAHFNLFFFHIFHIKYRRKLWNDMENMDEMWNDMENMEEKESWIVRRYEKYWRNPSWIVKRYGKYRRSFHDCLLYFPYTFTIQLGFLPYFSYLFTVKLAFLPYCLYLITIQLNSEKIRKSVEETHVE
jgi:hypothetical protein